MSALNDPVFENSVIAVFLLNARNRSFVPSSRNLIDGQQYEHVMCDSGCGSFLVPICQSSDLLAMRQRYPDSQYVWKLREGGGAAGTIVTLRINHRMNTPFNITLGDDIGGQQFQVPFLRFHICGEDVRFLLAVPEADGGFQDFMTETEENIRVLQNQQQSVSLRRNHVLMGQGLLRGRHHWTATDRYTYVFAAWPSHALYSAIGRGAASRALNVVHKHLPAGFDGLVDEDLGLSDVEDYTGDVEGDSGDETGDDDE